MSADLGVCRSINLRAYRMSKPWPFPNQAAVFFMPMKNNFYMVHRDLKNQVRDAAGKSFTTAWMVIEVLIDYQNQWGRNPITMSYARIAHESGITRRTVMARIEQLEACGFISVEHKGEDRRPNEFTLNHIETTRATPALVNDGTRATDALVLGQPLPQTRATDAPSYTTYKNKEERKKAVGPSNLDLWRKFKGIDGVNGVTENSFHAACRCFPGADIDFTLNEFEASAQLEGKTNRQIIGALKGFLKRNEIERIRDARTNKGQPILIESNFENKPANGAWKIPERNEKQEKR